MQVAFLGGEWWNITPGTKLEPLRRVDDETYFLTSDNCEVDAIGLAMMLGKTVENPLDCIDDELPLRVRQLLQLDIFAVWHDEKLDFEWSVEQSKPSSYGEERWRLKCRETTFDVCVFECDDFEKAEYAERWAQLYFDTLVANGIDVTEKKVKELKY